jgi:hypothetical protein
MARKKMRVTYKQFQKSLSDWRKYQQKVKRQEAEYKKLYAKAEKIRKDFIRTEHLGQRFKRAAKKRRQ